jgi:hypothetical protein
MLTPQPISRSPAQPLPEGVVPPNLATSNPCLVRCSLSTIHPQAARTLQHKAPSSGALSSLLVQLPDAQLHGAATGSLIRQRRHITPSIITAGGDSAGPGARCLAPHHAHTAAREAASAPRIQASVGSRSSSASMWPMPLMRASSPRWICAKIDSAITGGVATSCSPTRM